MVFKFLWLSAFELLKPRDACNVLTHPKRRVYIVTA